MRIPIDTLQMRIVPLAPGRALPWLGRALRGLVARRWKEEVCTRPRDASGALPERCRGCAEVQTCSYGLLFEPEPRSEAHTWQGQADALRPLIVAPVSYTHLTLPTIYSV